MQHKKRKIAILIILAIVCILGVELVACRHFAPELYQKITGPVHRGIDAVAALCQETLASAADLLEELQPEDPPVNQLAGEPTVEMDPIPADFSVTELLDMDGRQVLTGGAANINYFNQGDAAWKDQPYGSDDIGHYGCGPTVMAMVVSSITDTETDPAAMAAWAVDHGYWARRSGSYLSIVEGTAKAFGLQAKALSEYTVDAMREALLSGHLLVALMGPGHFTNGGHFILIRSIALTGEVLIADPNSTSRSLTTWDPQIILDELSSSRSNGAPLWAISPPASP